MKVLCDYCGNPIDETLATCPECGAVNKHMLRSGNQVPKTIEELQAFVEEHNIPVDRMRFFIGIDYQEPKAFGIFKRPDNQNCIVYKNKSGNFVKAVSSALKTTDIEDGSKSATFTFELEDPDKGEDVTYIYPAAMAGDDDVNFDALAT